MPERQLRQRIRAALRRAFPGALVLGWPANLWTGAGWPDLLFSEWPLLVGLEVKQGRYSKPTPLQRSRHVELRKHHIPVVVTYSPEHAVDTIQALKEKLPMAFDPSLLAELEAALNDAPADPAPSHPAGDAAIAAVDAFLAVTPEEFAAANGTATIEVLEAPVFEEIVLDADKPAPDIEDLTAAIVANTEILSAETDAVVETANEQIDTLITLVSALDNLTAAIADLRRDIAAPGLDVPQTADAPAPRRRTRRS